MIREEEGEGPTQSRDGEEQSEGGCGGEDSTGTLVGGTRGGGGQGSILSQEEVSCLLWG